MRRLTLPILFALVGQLAGCSMEGAMTDDDDDDSDPGPPDPAGTITIEGAQTADAIWAGTIELVADATVAAGVTITVSPGSQIIAADGRSIRVDGTLAIAGTAEQPVTILPDTDAIAWAGFVANAGGAVTIEHATGQDVATLLYCHFDAVACTLSYVDFTSLGSAIITETAASIDHSRFVGLANGGVTISDGGDLEITDSYLLTSVHDLIVQNGGRLTVDYSEIGDTQGVDEHCDFHINRADLLSITHSNIISGVYGMMIGGTDGAVIQYNNFEGNNIDVSETGVNTAADFRFNYWDGGAPALGAVYDTSQPATERLVAGPRD
jgi:hypothetical protein